MCLRRSRGFTMVELIMIIIILGILAVVALPRMDSATSFRSVEFRDQAIAALRYAQKTATSHRRLVCARLTQTSVALDIDNSNPKDSSCDVGLPIPGVATPTLSATQDGFSGLPSPSVLYFQPDGRVTIAAGPETAIANFDNTVDGSSVVVRGATGYVGDGS
jgi:prepilin-type N-terminal cleavage/methylation domain-containing protein